MIRRLPCSMSLKAEDGARLKRASMWDYRQQDTDNAVFVWCRMAAVQEAMGAMEEATATRSVQRSLFKVVWPSLLASQSGALWWASSPVGPVQAPELLEAMGYVSHHAALDSMVKSLSPAQARSVVGQSVHYGAMEKILQLLPRQAFEGSSHRVSQLGAGAGLWGLALLDRVGADRFQYTAFAEANANAVKAHHALWSALQQEPAHLLWAHDNRAFLTIPACDWMLISLQCSPYSCANRQFPAGVSMAIREFASALAVTARAKPKVIIVEQTGSLLRTDRKWARLQLENLMLNMKGIKWRACVVSPDIHLRCPIARLRIFYIGVRSKLPTPQV